MLRSERARRVQAARNIVPRSSDDEVVWFEGKYQVYIEDLKRPKEPDADQLQRVAYKKLGWT